jgi:putative protein-disulfide isomerase
MTGQEGNGVPHQAPRFLYIADAMCAWCWGFAPVLESLRKRHALAVDILVGGLRPGPESRLLDDGLRDYLLNEWTRARDFTGQPYDLAGLDREAWTYDTELPAMAIATMRELNEPATLSFLGRLQRAFYAENRDITDPDIYGDLVAGYAVDSASFVERMGSETAKQAAWLDFATARKVGVTQFPSLFVTDGHRTRLITNGYQSAERLTPIVDSALLTWAPRP